MVTRLEIKSKIFDTRAAVRKKRWQKMGFAKKIKDLFLVDVYTIDKNFTQKQLKMIASILANPVTQEAAVYKKGNSKSKKSQLKQKFNWAIEIGFLPGVTDNVANTAKESIGDLLKVEFKESEGVYTSQITFISGKISQKEVALLAKDLFNPIVQRGHLKSFQEFKKDQGMDFITPKVVLNKKPKVDLVDLEIEDEELQKIGKEGIANQDGTRRGPLALDLTYMKTIQAHFRKLGREPTDIELESIAQTWSEHCKHTIFADPIDDISSGLFKTYIREATNKIRKKKGKKDFCVSVFTDNSGALVFDRHYLITHKVETHNSPSALDPFGGAITGIVGVNRDAIGFGLGAKPIINIYGFCFGDPRRETHLYKDQKLSQPMLSPERIMDGVVAGVNSGGNCSGIPTTQGFVFFDPRYSGKPLVFVGTVGLIPRRIGAKKSYHKKAQSGDYIVMVGGRVGQDGIHGATFSSEALDSGSPATAVQIGDPITQKKLSDALVKEARDLCLYNSVTDNGAGGLSCSVAEMAKESGGCQVELNQVPLKYPGLEPWQIWISESQERMTIAVPKRKWKKFSNLMKARGVEATIIGKFTDSGRCVVKNGGQVIMNLEMNFLHNGLPPRPMKTTYTKTVYKEPKIPQRQNLTKILHEMLARLNIASFEFISQQYDHEVQGGSVLKPLQGRGKINGEATVVRPVLNSKKGVVISQGINPTYGDIDTYWMAAGTIDTAIRNAVVVGANPEYLALLDNFCWYSSNEPGSLGKLKQATKACYNLALAYGTPFISGKDSMFNDFKGYTPDGKPIKISIPPTLLVSSMGVIEDVSKVVSLDLKRPGDLIYILGRTNEELGASEYYALLAEGKNKACLGNHLPHVQPDINKKLYQALFSCIQNDLVASAIGVSHGGLAVALAKTAMGGMLGLEISLKKLPGSVRRNDSALFSESQGRIIVTIAPQNQKIFENKMKGNIFAQIGIVTTDKIITIKDSKGKNIIQTGVEEALKSYKSTLRSY